MADVHLRIITLSFDEQVEGFPDEIVTQFCLNKRIHGIQPKFFEQSGKFFWSVAIRYELVLEEEIDRSRELDEEQQHLFVRLKAWRKEQAEKVGLPVYLVATNDNLLKMIQLKCRSLESLKQVKGFGKNRIDKYGRHIIKLVKNYYDKEGEKKEDDVMVEEPRTNGELPFD